MLQQLGRRGLSLIGNPRLPVVAMRETTTGLLANASSSYISSLSAKRPSMCNAMTTDFARRLSSSSSSQQPRHRLQTEQTRRSSLYRSFAPASSPLRRRPQRNRSRRVLPTTQPPPLPKPESGYLIPVSARHIAQTIDLFPVLSAVFTSRNASRKHKMFGKTSFVVELPPSQTSRNRYVAVFRFGSIVALNVSPRELADIIREIKKHHKTEPSALSGFERKENFGILIQRPTPTPPVSEEEGRQLVVTGDYCIVPELDMNGVAVICNIMAQTVALDSYNDTVDGLLANFAEINATVVKTGTFTPSHRDFLLRTVAQNNSIFIDMISRVRIKDRSETAWNLVKYEDIHYGMKEEFEIDDRFDQIEFKLNLIQQNAKFFLNMLQDKKSNSLEWTIVVLILLECVLMCIEMSGAGEPLFQSLVKFF